MNNAPRNYISRPRARENGQFGVEEPSAALHDQDLMARPHTGCHSSLSMMLNCASVGLGFESSPSFICSTIARCLRSVSSSMSASRDSRSKRMSKSIRKILRMTSGRATRIPVGPSALLISKTVSNGEANESLSTSTCVSLKDARRNTI